MAFSIRIPRRTVANTTPLGSEGSSAPIIGVGIGTAGCWRLLKWSKQMGEGGRLDRVQSLLLYDFNQTVSDQIRKMTRQLRARGGTDVIIPERQRAVDGFHGNPNRWKDYQGLITQDLKDLVEELRVCSERKQSPPALILVFVGFGGHASLACTLYRMLKKTFKTTYLPILLLPDESPLYYWLHKQTWDEYEDAFKQDNVLITDNDAGNYEDLDYHLAVGLASLEVAETVGLKHGSLPEIVTSFAGFSFPQDPDGAPLAEGPRPSGKGFYFGLNVVRTRLQAQRRLSWPFPILPLRLVEGRDDSLAYGIRTALMEAISSDQVKLHQNGGPGIGVPQQVAVAIPIREPELPRLINKVMAQIELEDWYLPYKAMVQIRAGSANFPDNSSDKPDPRLEGRGPLRRFWDATSKWIPGLILGAVVFLGLAVPFWMGNNFLNMVGWGYYSTSGGVAAAVLVLVSLGTHGIYRRLLYGKYPHQNHLCVTVASLSPVKGPIERVLEIRRGQWDIGVRGIGYGDPEAAIHDPWAMGSFKHRDSVFGGPGAPQPETAGSTNGGVPFDPNDWDNRVGVE